VRSLEDVHDMLGAGVAPVGIVPGGGVLELKKSLLCISVQPFMLVYRSWIKAFLFFTFVSSNAMS
jgi:hypothetical protein